MFKAYAEPKLRFGYNNQSIVANKKDYVVTREYFDWSLRAGVYKEFRNRIFLGGEINLSGSYTKNVKMGLKTNIGYKWNGK